MKFKNRDEFIRQFLNIKINIADTLNKSMLIEKCLRVNNGEKNSAILVGDSMNDYKGAVEAGIDFLPVTYGFGFQNSSFLLYHGIVEAADSVAALKRLLTVGK